MLDIYKMFDDLAGRYDDKLSYFKFIEGRPYTHSCIENENYYRTEDGGIYKKSYRQRYDTGAFDMLMRMTRHQQC
jgi:hypothetical protein